jgi:ketosteroid isomerase-like protein
MNDSEEVENANSKFYQAFERLSIDDMEQVWSHGDNTVCVHPGWDLFTGWLAIRESWIRIFQNTQAIRFVITNTKIKVTNDIAVVVCLENIENVVDGQEVKFGVLATNIFERQNGKWLMIHHHGSTVTNYLPPNISSDVN